MLVKCFLLMVIFGYCLSQQSISVGLWQKDSQSQIKQQFQNWKQKYNIKFQLDELIYRQILFKEKLSEVNLHNQQNLGYFKGVNQFTTLNKDQLTKVYLNPLMWTQSKLGLISNEFLTGQLQNTTFSINWKDLGKVTPVRDQGTCGSCWAFSVIGAIESLSLIQNNIIVDLSEQQLVDCANSYGNSGCNGGWPSYAFNYVLYNGISLQSQYPYIAKTSSCRTKGGNFRIKGIKYSQGCLQLQNSLKLGPQSVAVDALNWFDYLSGIFGNCSNSLNHAVLLVGVNNNQWIIKNSWGKNWGQNGFIRLHLGNTCGICSYSTSFPS